MAAQRLANYDHGHVSSLFGLSKKLWLSVSECQRCYSDDIKLLQTNAEVEIDHDVHTTI